MNRKKILISIFLVYFIGVAILSFVINSKDSYSTTNLPSSFNLKTLGKVTPVVRQASDSCTFTSTATSLDSHVLYKWNSSVLAEYGWSSSNNIFNPSHFNWWSHYAYDTNVINFNSGNRSYLFAENGFPSYNDFNYRIVGETYTSTPSESATLNAHSKVRIIRGERWFWPSFGYNDAAIEKVKELIYNYGAVYFGGLAPEPDKGEICFNKTTGAFYCGNTAETLKLTHAGHNMTIIGWDDNYSKSNFKSGMQPTKDGAFIIQNSWGKKNDCAYNNNAFCVNDGILYYSYENMTLNANPPLYWVFNILGSIEKVIPNESDHIYSHNFVNYPTEDSQTRMNNYNEVIMKFKKSNDLKEQITSVELTGPLQPNIKAIYLNPNGTINNYSLEDERSGFIKIWDSSFGDESFISLLWQNDTYYNKDGAYIDINSGEHFAIGVVRSVGEPIRVLRGVSASNKASLEIKGQTYLYNGSTWEDISSLNGYDSTLEKYAYYYGLPIRVYTNEVNDEEPIINISYTGNNIYTISASASSGKTLSSTNQYKYYISTSSIDLIDGEWKTYNPNGTSFSIDSDSFVYTKRISDTSGNTSRTSGVEFYFQDAIPHQRFKLKSYSTADLIASLSSISITNASGGSNISLNETFNTNNYSYTATINTIVSSINVSAIANNNGTIISGTGTKSLNYGDNVINIVVQAGDGITRKTYTITVKRLYPESASQLSALTINTNTNNAVSLTPTFNSATYSYTGIVSNNVTSVTISATKINSSASLTGTGSKNLTIGENIIEIKVTAPDGITKKTYTIKIMKEEAGITLEETSEYVIEEEYLTIDDVGSGINKATFISNIQTNSSSYTIYESNGETVAGDTIKTGQIIKMGTKEYYITIMGDTNGDGASNIIDIMKIAGHLYQPNSKLTGAYEKAANINKNTGIEFLDITQLAKRIYE